VNTVGFFPTEIDEFYPQDGSLAKRITLEDNQTPVCEVKGKYMFVAPREEDGRLQVIHATPLSQ
jgi:hypothetical protein